MWVEEVVLASIVSSTLILENPQPPDRSQPFFAIVIRTKLRRRMDGFPFSIMGMDPAEEQRPFKRVDRRAPVSIQLTQFSLNRLI